MTKRDINPSQFAQLFDHTLLAAGALPAQFEKLCAEAAEYGFKMVAINSANVSLCKGLLKGTPVHVGAAISFPLGQTTARVKLFEASSAIEEGADEIDYVINIGKLKNGELSYIEEEMRGIVGLCRSADVTSKVIFENCYLTKDEIRTMCSIALSVGPDFIKTSTGFGTGGATVEDVELMKSCVGESVKVKASGGIRTLDSVLSMVDAGAQRIGSSSGVSIMGELLERLG
ncbi:MAG: deoxyribose-phosphate aldolase [Eubacteriales bacterium]